MVARRNLSSIPPKKTKLLRPQKIEPGDTIALIAPASPPLSLNVIDTVKNSLEQKGFRVQVTTRARKRLGYLAGTDSERLADFNNAIRSKKVRGILCIRGGYGTLRIVDKIDLKALKDDPKVIIGCSDITTIHSQLATRLNMVSFHGPVAQGLYDAECPLFTWNSFIHQITGTPKAIGSISLGYEHYGSTVYSLRKGRVTAPLIGGNLAVLTSLLGTPYFPDLRGKILFLEEIGEMPFRIDRSLTRLIMSGALDKVAGFALGLFKDCEYRPPKEGEIVEYKQKLRDVFAEKLLPFKKPVVVGLPFGHLPHNATLPILTKATLDGQQGDLILEEHGVI
jgi:muramoyltetrapeptide carboxypeptidase